MQENISLLIISGKAYFEIKLSGVRGTGACTTLARWLNLWAFKLSLLLCPAKSLPCAYLVDTYKVRVTTNLLQWQSHTDVSK